MAAKTKKKAVAKKTINIDGKDLTITAYRDSLLKQLKAQRDDVKACKRIRHILRVKCRHFGGLRNRTYVDKTTNTKINVDKPVTAKK